MPGPPQASTSLLNTYQSLLTTFSSFLTVAIHTILYERSIYPESTFISTKAYNFPVRQNRHPQVCQWINDAVTAVEAEMIKGIVSRVAVVIYNSQAEVMERFMFNVSGFPIIPVEERLTDLVDEDKVTTRLVDVEEQLRATVRKLAYCGSKLEPLPEGCTYTVVVEMRDEADPPIGHPQPWIPSPPSLQTSERGHSENIGADLGGIRQVPVRSVETGDFVFDMWIEEGRAKQDDTM